MNRVNRELSFYIELAKRYGNSKTWKKESYATYASAQRYGFLAECKKYMTVLWSPKWTQKEDVLADAKKYSYRKEWEKNSGSAVSAAKKNGWYKECVSHMSILSKRFDTQWTKEELKKFADKYTTRSEWQLSHCASHRAAQRLGYLNELTSHYRKDTSSSKPELELLAEVLKIYPTASKKRFGSPKKGEKANYFEIDIFIEDLNKGIEFNGNYWHSVEGLKRKLISWTEDEITNYHGIKRDFFKKRNIDYIEIYESEWKTNKQLCLENITKFLKEK